MTAAGRGSPVPGWVRIAYLDCPRHGVRVIRTEAAPARCRRCGHRRRVRHVYVPPVARPLGAARCDGRCVRGSARRRQGPHACACTCRGRCHARGRCGCRADPGPDGQAGEWIAPGVGRPAGPGFCPAGQNAPNRARVSGTARTRSGVSRECIARSELGPARPCASIP